MANFIGSISGFGELEPVKRKKSNPYANAMSGFNVGGGASDDGAEFSSFGIKLARISSELKGTPDIREDRIAAIKDQYEAGEYKPALEQIAHTLVMAGFLNTLIEE